MKNLTFGEGGKGTSIYIFLLVYTIIGKHMKMFCFIIQQNRTINNEFNFLRGEGSRGASKKILKSRNHALRDIIIFIDAPLNFPAPVERLNTIFFYCDPNSSYTKN